MARIGCDRRMLPISFQCFQDFCNRVLCIIVGLHVGRVKLLRICIVGNSGLHNSKNELRSRRRLAMKATKLILLQKKGWKKRRLRRNQPLNWLNVNQLQNKSQTHVHVGWHQNQKNVNYLQSQNHVNQLQSKSKKYVEWLRKRKKENSI